MSHNPEFTSTSCVAFHGTKAVYAVSQRPGIGRGVTKGRVAKALREMVHVKNARG
jgi:hypothetical protein